MIPRFANPHAVFEKTRIVSRKALQQEEDHAQPDLGRLDEFNAVMKRTLPHFDVEERGKKRRKVEDEPVEEKAQHPLLFRLVSNGPPRLISLQPKPERALKIREPETEDNEVQAEERRKRALAVAVDAEWVMQESLKPSATQGSVIHITLPSSLTLPSPLMIISHNKPVRKTRPPVDHKLGYPYDARAKPKPLDHKDRGYDCPVIDLDRVLEEGVDVKRKRRRRRKTMK